MRCLLYTSNGQLSILKKEQCKVRHPEPLISDGIINQSVLDDLHQDVAWLLASLRKEGVERSEDVFLCMLQKNGLFVIKKETRTRNAFFSHHA